MNTRAEFPLKGYAQKDKVLFSYENQTFHIYPIPKVGKLTKVLVNISTRVIIV